MLRIIIILGLLVFELLHFELEDLGHEARQCVVHLEKRVKVARVTDITETCRLIFLANTLINTSYRLVARVMRRLLVDASLYSCLDVCILSIARCKVNHSPVIVVLAASIILLLGLQTSLYRGIYVILRAAGSVGWRDAALAASLHVLSVLLHLRLGGHIAAAQKDFKCHLLVPVGTMQRLLYLLLGEAHRHQVLDGDRGLTHILTHILLNYFSLTLYFNNINN